MKVLVTGDSHTAALVRGLAALKSAGELDPAVELTVRRLGSGQLLVTPFWRAETDRAELVEPTYRRHMTRLPPEDHLDAIGLCMPMWPMRVVRRIVSGGNCLVEPEPDRQAISQALFRNVVLRDQRYVLGLFEHLKAIGISTFAVSAPGMFRDHFNPQVMKPAAALGLFQAYRKLMAAELDVRKIPLVDVPSECLDDDGFMRAEFRHPAPGDAHHANTAFGEMMVLALQRFALANRGV